ncbi:Nn.00g106880.m01.CDS01 [Neocucurbitaria sp. VM-36]
MHRTIYSLFSVFASIQAANLPSEFTDYEKSATGVQIDPYFCSVVFNSVAKGNAGWPNTTWNTLNAYGVDKWVGFLDLNLTGHPRNVPEYIMSANEPLVVFNPENVDRGLELLKQTNASNRPTYMELLNEPDIPLGGRGKISPRAAAKAVKPILDYNKAHNVMTLLAPGLSHPDGIWDAEGWLAQFDGNCSGCITSMEVPIIASHQYNLAAKGVVESLKRIHARWPKHSIWVTELAPSTHVLNNCPMTIKQVGDWMETVVNGAASLGYVGRIFWNSGEWRPKVSDNDCIHSLTYDNGTATPLLKRYESLCENLGLL